jgi:hypothetical protein
MPTARSSKRLQGQPPSGEKNAKRTRRPNSNTLERFQAGQSPIIRYKRPKKKAIRPRDPPKPEIERYTIPSTPITIQSDPPGLHTSPIDGTQFPKRTKKPAQPPPPPFDPSIEQATPHNVSIFMTPVIDDIRKEKTFSKSMNINCTTRDDFDDLRGFLYAKYIREFETVRNLKLHEKPKLSY